MANNSRIQFKITCPNGELLYVNCRPTASFSEIVEYACQKLSLREPQNYILLNNGATVDLGTSVKQSGFKEGEQFEMKKLEVAVVLILPSTVHLRAAFHPKTAVSEVIAKFAKDECWRSCAWKALKCVEPVSFALDGKDCGMRDPSCTALTDIGVTTGVYELRLICDPGKTKPKTVHFFTEMKKVTNTTTAEGFVYYRGELSFGADFVTGQVVYDEAVQSLLQELSAAVKSHAEFLNYTAQQAVRIAEITGKVDLAARRLLQISAASDETDVEEPETQIMLTGKDLYLKRRAAEDDLVVLPDVRAKKRAKVTWKNLDEEAKAAYDATAKELLEKHASGNE